METPDHFPWDDSMLRAINPYPPGGTPAQPAPAQPAAYPVPAQPPLPPPGRFVKRGFYMCCVTCGMAVEWCGCAKAPSPPPTQGDGESSDLNRRIREAQGR